MPAKVAKIEYYMSGSNRTNAILKACRLERDELERLRRHRNLMRYLLPALMLFAMVAGVMIGALLA